MRRIRIPPEYAGDLTSAGDVRDSSAMLHDDAQMTDDAARAIAHRVRAIRERIARAAAAGGREPATIRLIGVSKTQRAAAVAAAARAGLTDFGENYAQELVEKCDALAQQSLEQHARNATALADNPGITPLTWHFIGHLQRNKAKFVAPRVAWLHTLDSADLARALAKHRTTPLACLIEVNLGDEPSKSGVAPNDVAPLIHACREFPLIHIRGLMCIPPPGESPDASRPHFRALRELRDTLNARGDLPTPLTELSMGMSHDFEIAIEEGATMIRIGTAIFGERAITR